MKRRFILLLFLCATATAQAQPNAGIRLVESLGNNQYLIKLAVECGGQTYYNLASTDMTIVQDNDTIPVTGYTIDRVPSPQTDACYNVALVFDRSSSVPGYVFSGMMEGGRAFIDNMHNGCQEATVVSYSNTLDIHEFLTPNGTALRNALGKLSLSGGIRVYSIVDGIRTGMIELGSHGNQPIRAIIATTAGWDEMSPKMITDLVDDARAMNYRLFIIGIGSMVDGTSLAALAQGTGGLFLQAADSAAIPPLYAKLAGFIQREFDEYHIRYQSPRSTSPQKLRVTVSACGGTATTEFAFPSSGVNISEVPAAPQPLALTQVAPHPLSAAQGAARITFSVAPSLRNAHARLVLVDLFGRVVSVPFDGDVEGDARTVSLDASALSPGMYLCVLESGPHRVSRRIVVTR